MRRPLLVFPFAFYHAVRSSPVPPNAIKSRAELPLLVLLFAFISLLFGLFFIKWLYIMRRRQAKRRGSRTTLPSGWYDNFSTSSLRFGKLFIGSGDVKSGFLIGLLGSPTWETRYSAVIADHNSILREPSVSTRKSASGLSQRSKSCSSPCAFPPSAVPGENIHVVNTQVSPPSPVVTINRSPLLSDNEYLPLLHGLPSAFPFGIPPLMNSSPINPCTKNVCVPMSSVTNHGTIQVEYPHSLRQGESNLATSISKIKMPSQLPKPTDAASLDAMGVPFLRAQPSSPDQDTQKSLERFYGALPFPNFVQRFESTLTSINEHSSNIQSHSVESTSNPFPPSVRSYKSPRIGPSPLRTMILPTDRNPDSFQSFSENQQIRPLAHDALNTGTDPPEILGLDHGQNVQLSLTQTPGPKKSTDADSLLDLMSELAQETSAWDPNVFMDENFKRLIAHSEPQALFKENTVRPRRRSRRPSHRKIQHMFTTLEDIPEVDVTEMMPTFIGDTFIHSFWSDGDDDRQFLISMNAR